MYDHILWYDYVQQLCQLVKFESTYCMSESAFDKPLGMLNPKQHKGGAMPNNSTGELQGVFIPEITMSIGIVSWQGQAALI